MSLNHESPIERIHPKRRALIGAHVIGIWFMQDLADNHRGLKFLSNHDTQAFVLMLALADEEYSDARRLVSDVRVESNRHIAFQQMQLSTKTISDNFSNKRAYPSRNFLVATRVLEDDVYRQKLEAEHGIDALIDAKLGPEARDYYKDIAVRTLDAQGTSTNIRQLTAHTIHDAQFWLES